MKILVVGAGYVGLANALVLAKNNKVAIIDIDEAKLELIQNGISPLKEEDSQKLLRANLKNISCGKIIDNQFSNYDIAILALPTNFDEKRKSFDTILLKQTVSQLNKINFTGDIIIRSTIPVGFTNSIISEFYNLKICFFPEFLREGKTITDTLYPDRIIAGGESSVTKKFKKLMRNSILKQDVEIIETSVSEAEAIKLFSNTYLAMRISFFNELDSFALLNNFDSRKIVNGLSLDSRIGNMYNNPSFGYGGYCLPKDTKQIIADLKTSPRKLIRSIHLSNEERKKFIAKDILDKCDGQIGIYKLSMKSGSDNFRNSSVLEILKLLNKNGKKILIYEPLIKKNLFLGNQVEANFKNFIEKSDLIIANRLTNKLIATNKKIYTRDLFRKN